MKRYLLFGWIKEGQGHGWNDFIGTYDFLDDARYYAQYWQYYQIVEDGKIIAQHTFLEE